jgi:GntP family gluconate:H+ symporter
MTLAPTPLLICTALIVLALIVVVARLHVPAFIALLLASLAVGTISGLSVPQTAKAFQAGVGNVLGQIVMIVGLGTVLGKLLAESGGAQVIAETMLGLVEERWLPWMMGLLGFVIGPIFFALGLILLAPVLFAVHKKAKLPFLFLAVPLLAGLSAAQGLVPPHPGPLAAIQLLRADMGKTMMYSLLIGTGAFIISGPLLCRACPWWRTIEPTGDLGKQFEFHRAAGTRPHFWPALLVILLPILLILGDTAVDLLISQNNPWRRIPDALGTPLVALLLAVLLAYWVLGIACGFDRPTLLKFTTECMAPIAPILLVVGAGGGFSRVMTSGGVGDAIAEFSRHVPVSPLIYGWFIAAIIRVATGSATVAIITAAGIIAPAVAVTPGVNPNLLVIALGAGSLILSHVNDGGFWLVKEYLGLSMRDTFKSWTIAETVLSTSGLLLTLLFNFLIHI